MKKIVLSIALCLFAGGMMAQSAADKAAAKEAAKALKAATKEAKANMESAQKVKDEIYARAVDKEKPATEEEIISACKMGQELIQKSLKSGLLDEKMLGDAYKLSGDLALYPLNLYLNAAKDKIPFDTAHYYDNLFLLTDAMHKELQNTKEIKTGEKANTTYLEGKRKSLAQCADYFAYAGQFESECHHYDRALKAYDFALNYAKTYPEIADILDMRVTPEQISYYAYYCAHEAGNFEAMEKFYDKAVQLKEGALGVRQLRAQSYMERGDTVSWAAYVHDLCLESPKDNLDFIQILLAYYQKQGIDKMEKFADEVIAKDADILIANYGKAYVYFQAEKYDEAMTYYKKCTEIKPDYYDAWYQCGMCCFRQAMAKNSTISSIKNRQQAQKALDETKALFGSAIPYFEKARECAPDQPHKWAYELKQCYSVTGQSAKAAEMDALL
ncbi:MAG: tetratricopeptide repeat protein [Bacteroidaceae bacterium]|nr:tetratricopeptide repeat protein [Bacteroidaceae bacterium]